MKVAAVVPLFPSVTVTSLTVIEGVSVAGQVPSLSRTETLLEPELADATSATAVAVEIADGHSDGSDPRRRSRAP